MGDAGTRRVCVCKSVVYYTLNSTDVAGFILTAPVPSSSFQEMFMALKKDQINGHMGAGSEKKRKNRSIKEARHKTKLNSQSVLGKADPFRKVRVDLLCFSWSAGPMFVDLRTSS